MTNPLIDAPDELTIPPSVGGISQQTWDQIAFWNTRGVVVQDQPGGRSLIDIPRYLLSLQSVDTWTSLGSIITDYPFYHELSDITLAVPASYTDVYGSPGETWQTWGVDGESHKPIEIDGTFYRSSLYGPLGMMLASPAWYSFIASGDAASGIVRLLTVEEFQAIQPTGP